MLEAEEDEDEDVVVLDISIIATHQNLRLG